jgi:RNA polymerase sigma-70 factor (ECF subfamily)
MDVPSTAVAPGRRATFETTRWSLVVAAGDASIGAARVALEELCRIYRYPLYCFVRRAGFQHADADDLTQQFFAQLLRRGLFAQASESRGRLRGFLTSRLRFFLRDAVRRAVTVKSGGAFEFVPLDFSDAEACFAAMRDPGASPEAAMDRAWAHQVVHAAMEILRDECAYEGRGALFEALRPYFLEALSGEAQRAIAAQCGTSEDNVKVTLHRLRRRFGLALREVVAETVETVAEIEAEMASLRAALG